MAKAKIKKASILDNDVINEMIANETILQTDFADDESDLVQRFESTHHA